MSHYTAILRCLEQDAFGHIFAASTRQDRETYYHRHMIKKNKIASLSKPGSKNEARTIALWHILQQQEDEDMAAEILRTWLMTKRAMLACALDHLHIEHVNGLTDSDDLNRIKSMSLADIQTMVTALQQQQFPLDDIKIYLKFIEAPYVEEVCAGLAL